MMRRMLAPVLVLALSAVPAVAGNIVLRDLIASGFAIVGTTVVPVDVVKRALNGANVQDELLIVLQRADQLAFCHIVYSGTFSDEGLMNDTCFEPQGAASEPPAPAPAASSAAAPSSELPLSTASSAQ